MSPYASIALLALVLSVAAQNNAPAKTTVNANVNWNKQANQAVGNVNVNGKTTPFTFNIASNGNKQPTFTIESKNPDGKTTTVKIIPIKPITSPLPQQTTFVDPPKPVHQDVPLPMQSAAPVPPTPATIPVSMPVPVPMPAPAPKPVPVTMPAPAPKPVPAPMPAPAPKPVVTTVRTSTFTIAEPNKPVVTVRSQTVNNGDNKPVTVTVVSVSKPEPVKGGPAHFPHPTPKDLPQPVNNIATVETQGPAGETIVDCENPAERHHPHCQDGHHEEKKRRGCNRRLWIKGCILGLAAFGALAFLALCCRCCRGRSHSCCCRRRHPECERNPTYGVPAPAPINVVGQPQHVFVVQAQSVDPYFQPTPTNTNRTAQPFVQLNETHPDTSANYVIGYPQPNDQPIYMIPQRN